MLLIFSTIPLASQLSGLSDTAKTLFVLVPTISVSGYIIYRLVRSDAPLALALATAALILILFATLRLVTPAERSHLIEYAALAVFAREALRERAPLFEKSWGWSPVVIVGVTLVGLADELVQLIVPGRVFDWRDIFVDFCAAMLGIGISAAGHRLSQRSKR